MAKKRGGIAGFYDRNKGLLQKAVPAALSFVPGVGIPLAAGAGALMRGLDRPGQRGIGFNAFEGLRGGVEGALTGATTQAVAGGVKGLLAPKAAGVGMGGATGAAGQAGGYGGVGSMPGVGFGLGGQTGGELGGQATGTQPMRWRDALKQPQVLASGVQGLLGMLPDAKSAAMEEQTKLGQGQLALQQAQFEEEKRRADMEQERKRRIAELLMPYIQQQYSQYYGGGQ